MWGKRQLNVDMMLKFDLVRISKNGDWFVKSESRLAKVAMKPYFESRRT